MFSNERGLNKPKNKPCRLCSTMREDWTNQRTNLCRLCSSMREDWTNQRTNLADFVQQWERIEQTKEQTSQTLFSNERLLNKSHKACTLSNNYLTTLPFPHPLCTDRRDQSTALGVHLLTSTVTSQMTLLPGTVKWPNNWAEDIVSPPIFVHILITIIHAHHNDTSWPRPIITPARQILIPVPHDQVKTWPFLAKWARQVVEIVLCGGPGLFGLVQWQANSCRLALVHNTLAAPEARLPPPYPRLRVTQISRHRPSGDVFSGVQVTHITPLTIAFLL